MGQTLFMLALLMAVLTIMVSAAPDCLPAYANYQALNLDINSAEEYSPLVHVRADDAPMLLIAGDQDKLVRIQHSENIYRAFEEKKVETKFVPTAGAGHGFPGDDLNLAIKEMVAWFEQHLAKKEEK